MECSNGNGGSSKWCVVMIIVVEINGVYWW